jgi:hypothetical protein
LEAASKESGERLDTPSSASEQLHDNDNLHKVPALNPVGPSDESWKAITPLVLIRAVTHIRKDFKDQSFWKCYYSQEQCFNDLHPLASSLTEPAIFTKHFYACVAELRKLVSHAFERSLAISCAQKGVIGEAAIEWAALQVTDLVDLEDRFVDHWIKSACDGKNDAPRDANTLEDRERRWERRIFWTDWRAPEFLGMEPNGNFPYNASTAWQRMDEGETKSALKFFRESRWILLLQATLRDQVGTAYEKLARQEKASQSRSQHDLGSTPAEKSDGRECSEADCPPSDGESAGQSSSDAACGMAAIASSNTENVQLDRRLLAPKLRDLADEMHKRIVDGERLIQFEVSQSRNEARYLPRLFEFHKQLTDDWVSKAHAAYCETYKEQNRSVTPRFIRWVCDKAIRMIETRRSTVLSQVLRRAVGRGQQLAKVNVDAWNGMMGRLSTRWSGKLEADAVACQYRMAKDQQAGRKPLPEHKAEPQRIQDLPPPQPPTQAPSLAQLASPEERALVPNHLTGSAVEQFLEELLATKALIKTEAEKIWNGCSNAHRMISVAANDEKRRVFSEQYERWRDQLIELQETLIVGRLLPLVVKYQIFANEQKWLLQACHEVWRPVTAGYLDWLTFVVRGHVHGNGTGAIPEWAWQLPGGPRDVSRLDLTAEKKASAHFRGLVDTLQRDLALYREGAIAKAFLMRNTNESPIVDSGMRVLEPEADHGPVTIQADRGNRSRVGLPRTYSAPLSVFEATVGKLMVQARKECPTKYLPLSEISKIATLLDDQKMPLRDNLEHAAARTVAEHNKQHPRAAIKTWQTALSYPRIRHAVRKRFWRAEDKYKKASPSIADSSAGTPRTTI